MVTASARKKLPVTPVVAIRGTKTTTGVMVEKISGVEISRRARRTASVRDWPLSRWTTMFSTTTMASSITSPMAAARPSESHQVEGLSNDPEEQNLSLQP